MVIFFQNTPLKKSPCRMTPNLLSILLSTLIIFASASVTVANYVGSEACRPCHLREYVSFVTHAKKSKSFASIERLQSRLTKKEIIKCYSCHTTGYGKPGGFLSPDKTPHLKNAGCEVCHGPGKQHSTSQKKTDITRTLSTKDCQACHTSERIKAFRYKPLIHGGAH